MTVDLRIARATELSQAIGMAAHIHSGQVDKVGAPYILHPLAVMRIACGMEGPSSLNLWNHHVAVVSVLHDVIEDIKGTKAERQDVLETILIRHGEVVGGALNALTKRPGEAYIVYIERVATNDIATVVKIADLEHNMDTNRLPADGIDDDSFMYRWHGYARALTRLKLERVSR